MSLNTCEPCEAYQFETFVFSLQRTDISSDWLFETHIWIVTLWHAGRAVPGFVHSGSPEATKGVSSVLWLDSRAHLWPPTTQPVASEPLEESNASAKPKAAHVPKEEKPKQNLKAKTNACIADLKPQPQPVARTRGRQQGNLKSIRRDTVEKVKQMQSV